MSQHNHLTRDIKGYGHCPACDLYWKYAYPDAASLADEDAAYVADQARAELADILAAANERTDDA